MNKQDVESFHNLCKANEVNEEELNRLLSIEEFLDGDVGDEYTPLQFVMKNLNDKSNAVMMAIAKKLIRAGANPHKNYKANSKSPIELAIENNQGELIELMFDCGADPRIRLNNEDTLLHIAISVDIVRPEIVKILLRNGVDPEAQNVNISSVDFVTTLAEVNDEYPSYQQKSEMITSFIASRNKAREAFKMLCQTKTFDANALNTLLKDTDFLVYDIEDGYTPLQYAIACAYTQDEKLSLADASTALKAAEVLIKAGAKLDREHPVKDEYSPLALAIRANQPDLLRQMLECGGSANFMSKNGNSLLHTAVNHADSIEIFEILLAHGADPTITNRLGETPIDNAEPLEVALMKQYIKSSEQKSAVDKSQILGPIAQVLNAMVDKNLKTDIILKLNLNQNGFNNALKNDMHWTGYKGSKVKIEELHGVSQVINDMYADDKVKYACDVNTFSPEVQKALFNIVAYAGKLTLEPKSRFKHKNQIKDAKYQATITFLKEALSSSPDELQDKVEKYMKDPAIIKNRGTGIFRIHGIHSKKGKVVKSTMQELFFDLNKVLEAK